jgi:hypothetical protein
MSSDTEMMSAMERTENLDPFANIQTPKSSLEVEFENRLLNLSLSVTGSNGSL